MEPIERSIPAINITNVIPMEAIPNMDTWRAIVNKLLDEINLWLDIEKAINRIKNTTQIAFSFTILRIVLFIFTPIAYRRRPAILPQINQE